MARVLSVPRTSKHRPWKHHIEDNEVEYFDGRLIRERFDCYDSREGMSPALIRASSGGPPYTC